MYYRIAVQTSASPTLRWQSDPLCSVPMVINWLLYFRVFPPERLRVFSSDCREGLDEQLRRANQGWASTSVLATHYVPKRANTPRASATEGARSPSAKEGYELHALAEHGHRPPQASTLDQRREALEYGDGGDHDLPYRFSLPTSAPEVLAWVKLLARVRHGGLQAEDAAAVGAEQCRSDVCTSYCPVSPI